MKSINPVGVGLPIILVNHFLVEIENQFGHRLTTTVHIAGHLQMNAVSHLNRRLRAVHRIFLRPNGRKFRVGHREDEFAGEFFFLWNPHHWIFHMRFAITIRDGLFRWAKQLFVPAIPIRRVPAFDAETIRQNRCPFDRFAVFVLHDDQHLFEFNRRRADGTGFCEPAAGGQQEKQACQTKSPR